MSGEFKIIDEKIGLLGATALAAAVTAIPTVFLLLTTQMPAVGVAILGRVVLGSPVYRYRIRRYAARGIDLETRMKQLYEHEQAQAAQ